MSNVKLKDFLLLPNTISIIRIGLVAWGGLELARFQFAGNLNAFFIFLTAIISDFLDGWLARYTNQISDLGKILDPLADKLMIITMMVLLFLQNRMPLWYLLFFAICSLYNLVGSWWINRKIKIILPSIMIGKIAAVWTMLTCMLNIVYISFIQYLYVISVILISISIVWYTRIALKQLSN